MKRGKKQKREFIRKIYINDSTCHYYTFRGDELQKLITETRDKKINENIKCT